VSYGVNPLIISALWECPPPVPITIGSKNDLWSEQISKIALRFLRFARSSLVFGGEAAELHPEFTLYYNLRHKRTKTELVCISLLKIIQSPFNFKSLLR
jgi:hypothetical protein